MFLSQTPISRFLDDLIADMGLYTDRDRAFYRARMNEALTFLYTAVIRMRAEGEATPFGGHILCNSINNRLALQIHTLNLVTVIVTVIVVTNDGSV